MSHVMARLMGGLGNQMFQYAAGKSLATRLGVSLFLDRTFLDNRSTSAGLTMRNYELDVFRIDARVAEKGEVKKMRRPIDSKLSRLIPGVFSNHVFRETEKIFLKEFEDLSAPVYLEGFWQCEKYFLSIADSLINKDFVPVETISGLNSELLDRINSTSSVGLHVRRNDYVTNLSAAQFHGVCSVDYYERAAKLIVEKAGAEHCFVFSDEIEWVKANLHLPGTTTYVSYNKGRESYWDMFLMKNCKHHIIANSSFSWWGAWLNPSKEKIVIAPEKWFVDPASQRNEIIPVSWIKL